METFSKKYVLTASYTHIFDTYALLTLSLPLWQ